MRWYDGAERPLPWRSTTPWGVMVSEGRLFVQSGVWWLATFPGLMIFLWALAFNLVGDGLRDALDPRTEGR